MPLQLPEGTVSTGLDAVSHNCDPVLCSLFRNIRTRDITIRDLKETLQQLVILSQGRTWVFRSAPVAPRLPRPPLSLSSALRAQMTASRFILSSHASDRRSSATHGITRDLSHNCKPGGRRTQWRRVLSKQKIRIRMKIILFTLDEAGKVNMWFGSQGGTDRHSTKIGKAGKMWFLGPLFSGRPL